MVRKSVLVYDLLRTEQWQEGFSEKEIVEQISSSHDIAAGKGLRRQVAVALRRGIDFGILTKKNNKYRFDPDGAKASTASRETASRNSRSRRKKTPARSTRTKGRSKSARNKKQKRSRPAVQPKMPKPWTPNRRNLADEPVSKVKKIHPDDHVNPRV